MKRKNNIFFSAFVLIATFAFIISPLGVYADSAFSSGSEISESECTSQGGTVKHNFYLFLTQAWVGEDGHQGYYNKLQNLDGHSETKNTGKKFKIGFTTANDKIIKHGKVNVTTSTTDSSDGLQSWSLNTFYTIRENIRQNGGTDEQITEGKNSYALASVWYDENGDETTANAETPPTVAESKAASYNQNYTFNADDATVRVGHSGIIQIERTYTPETVSSAQDPWRGNVFHPAVYYLKYCAFDSNASGGDEPSTDGGVVAQVMYKIEYNANGGVGAPETQTANVGKSLTISSTKPSYVGNVFLGWSTDPKATEPMSQYAPGQVYSDSKDLKLYAVWSPKTGVSDYLMATAIIAGVAGLGLFISKRKKLFKQI